MTYKDNHSQDRKVRSAQRNIVSYKDYARYLHNLSRSTVSPDRYKEEFPRLGDFLERLFTKWLFDNNTVLQLSLLKLLESASELIGGRSVPAQLGPDRPLPYITYRNKNLLPRLEPMPDNGNEQFMELGFYLEGIAAFGFFNQELGEIVGDRFARYLGEEGYLNANWSYRVSGDSLHYHSSNRIPIISADQSVTVEWGVPANDSWVIRELLNIYFSL